MEEAMAPAKRRHRVVHEMGIPRISTITRLGNPHNGSQTMDEKVQSVEARLMSPAKTLPCVTPPLAAWIGGRSGNLWRKRPR